ncbi:MAG: cytochrome c [Candidatus Binatia bacterium]
MSRPRQFFVALLGAMFAGLGLHGCMRGCESSKPPILVNTSMFNQPKARAYAASDFFFDGKAMRAPVAGTIARGQLPSEGLGSAPDRPPVDEALLARGRERYAIYCAPCHDERGEGRGVLFERAKVPTKNLLDKAVREQTDEKLFSTITDGSGLMPAYRYPIPAADRWAIIAYVRSLQAAETQREASR